MDDPTNLHRCPMKNIPNPPPLQIAHWCLKNSIVPLPVTGKRPTISDWPNFCVTTEDLSQHFNGGRQNIGALLGPASQGLVDIDLDWPECEQLADAFLPSSWRFGRRDDAGEFHLRHVLLRCKDATSQDWKAPASVFQKPLSIVQLLAGGKHVVLPGSVHEGTGQEITWRDKPAADALAEIPADQLLHAVNRLAGTALLARLWPDLEGSRHEVALALAGACHHASWTFDETAAMAIGLLTAAHDEQKRDRIKAVQSTLQRAADGHAVTGFPKLAELLPPDVSTCLQKWWGLGEFALQLPGPVVAGAGQDNWGSSLWPELLEFEAIPPSLAVYPVNALGAVMAPAAHELIRVQQVPMPLGAQSVLSVAAGAAQPHFDVLIDGRRIPLSLWLALIAQAGERKTSTDRKARARTETRLQEALIAYKVVFDAWLAAKKEGDAGPRPRKPTWILTRGTVQGLLKQLDINSPHMLFSTADAGGWFGGYSMREGRAAETVSVLSDLWSGETLTTALASEENASEMFNRRLSMSFMLQPKIAADLFDIELMRSQGFLSRCLPAYPDTRIGQRLYQAPGEMTGLQGYWDAIDQLLQRQPNMDLETGKLNTSDMTLSSDAYGLWVDAYNRVEVGMAKGQQYAGAVEVANKMPEQALRLAGVITAMDGKSEIDADTMRNGIALMDYYLGEWLSLAGKLRAHKASINDAQQLWVWLEQRRDQAGETTCTLRSAYKAGPRFIRGQSGKTKELVNELIRRGYVRMSGNGYEIRPADQCEK